MEQKDAVDWRMKGKLARKTEGNATGLTEWLLKKEYDMNYDEVKRNAEDRIRRNQKGSVNTGLLSSTEEQQ